MSPAQIICAVAILLTFESASAQRCRRDCASNETADARGCCVPGNHPPPVSAPPRGPRSLPDQDKKQAPERAKNPTIPVSAPQQHSKSPSDQDREHTSESTRSSLSPILEPQRHSEFDRDQNNVEHFDSASSKAPTPGNVAPVFNTTSASSTSDALSEPVMPQNHEAPALSTPARHRSSLADLSGFYAAAAPAYFWRSLNSSSMGSALGLNIDLSARVLERSDKVFLLGMGLSEVYFNASNTRLMIIGASMCYEPRINELMSMRFGARFGAVRYRLFDDFNEWGVHLSVEVGFCFGPHDLACLITSFANELDVIRDEQDIAPSGGSVSGAFNILGVLQSLLR